MLIGLLSMLDSRPKWSEGGVPGDPVDATVGDVVR